MHDDSAQGLSRQKIISTKWAFSRLPTKGWFVAEETQRVRRQPTSVRILGRSICLIRKNDGSAQAFEDRCPHRQVPISSARWKGDRLVCPYHGWAFDETGICREIPGLGSIAKPTDIKLCNVPTLEENGWVWVYLGREDKELPGLNLGMEAGESDLRCTQFRMSMPASLFQTLENILDVPHTKILHRGLFRSESETPVQVLFRTNTHYCEASYQGERVPKGLLGRILGGEEEKINHIDRYFYPNIAHVDYQMGNKRILVIDSLTPRDTFETEIFSRVYYKVGLPDFLVQTIARFLLLRILKQDQKILTLQNKGIQASGEEIYRIAKTDIFAKIILRVLSGQEIEPSEKALDLFI